MDSPITSSGVPIHAKNVRDSSRPIAVSTAPDSTDTGTAVCTVSSMSPSRRAPMACATVTPAPTDRPMNRLMIRLVSAPVAPTAATDSCPQNQPTTIRSAELNSSCSTPVRTIGIV